MVTDITPDPQQAETGPFFTKNTHRHHQDLQSDYFKDLFSRPLDSVSFVHVVFQPDTIVRSCTAAPSAQFAFSLSRHQ